MVRITCLKAERISLDSFNFSLKRNNFVESKNNDLLNRLNISRPYGGKIQSVTKFP